MTNGVASWRRQESWRSKTQVGWLALNRKTPHPLRPQRGKQEEWLAGDLRVRMSGNGEFIPDGPNFLRKRRRQGRSEGSEPTMMSITVMIAYIHGRVKVDLQV